MINRETPEPLGRACYRVATLSPGSPELETAWSLYKHHSNTLGFLPRGAFDEFALAGHVAGAFVDSNVVGYVAWRRANHHAVVVHLCVDAVHRRGPHAVALLRYLISSCSDLEAVRLNCREDYTAANRLWPNLGFRVANERPGRGTDQARLLRWQIDLREPPCLA